MPPSGFVRTLTSTGALSPLEFLDRTSTSHSVFHIRCQGSRLLTKGAFQIASANCGPRALSILPWARSLASWRRWHRWQSAARLRRPQAYGRLSYTWAAVRTTTAPVSSRRV